MDSLLQLAIDHKWVAVSALVIGALARAAKAGKLTPLMKVQPRYRPVLVMGLGIASGVLQAVVAGTSWTQALMGGVVASCVAMGGHGVLIESLRGGRELGEKKE